MRPEEGPGAGSCRRPLRRECGDSLAMPAPAALWSPAPGPEAAREEGAGQGF